MYTIIDEHAWRREEILRGEIIIEDKESCSEYVICARKEQGEICYSRRNTEQELQEQYGTYEETMESEFADYYAIVDRMLRELSGKIPRTRYEIVQKRTRMTDNFLEKIPESEIEIEFHDGLSLFLYAYEAASFVEYGISTMSWLDQNEAEEKLDRKKHILESYDSFQESIQSDYAVLFVELNEMLKNADNFVDEYEY